MMDKWMINKRKIETDEDELLTSNLKPTNSKRKNVIRKYDSEYLKTVFFLE